VATGLTVPAGDPQELRQLAAQLRTAGQAAGKLGSNTTTLTTTIPLNAQWTGEGSESFGLFAGNLGKGAGACSGPLLRIATVIDNYADVLDTAQQKARAATVLSQAVADTGHGSLIVQAQTAQQNAADAANALQLAGDQAAGEVTSAAAELQVENLFGTQGSVTTWINGQPILSHYFLWNSSNPIPRGLGGTGVFPPLPRIGGKPGTGSGIFPPGELGPLGRYDTAQAKPGGKGQPSPTPSSSPGQQQPSPSPSATASPSPAPSPWPTAGHGHQLPRSGQYPYVPPKQGHGQPVRVKGGGFKDDKGNTWIWAPPQIQHGGPHWDVQLKDGGHINVSPTGKIY
jgi:hypothetical protein